MENKRFDIHKSGGILLKNRRLLVCKPKDKEFFYAPGGRVENSETPAGALIRELQEELSITVRENALEKFGIFYAPSAGDEKNILRMDVFLINEWEGEPHATSEIETLDWITSAIPEGMKVGSIFEHEVIPRLKEKNLID